MTKVRYVTEFKGFPVKYWFNNIGNLVCPVCGEGKINQKVVRGKLRININSIFVDIKSRSVSCVKCWCPLTVDWREKK